MFFKKKEEPENLKELLEQFGDLKKSFEKLSQGLESLKKNSKVHIQKVGIVRYNPFSNAGGDQSFSIALLDENNDGVIITSLYAQDSNRVYAKSVKQGQSEHSLSEEERKAITKALE
jgi:Protein of unknown function (DUF4446)